MGRGELELAARILARPQDDMRPRQLALNVETNKPVYRAANAGKSWRPRLIDKAGIHCGGWGWVTCAV
jgi:hypothetical protein